MAERDKEGKGEQMYSNNNYSLRSVRSNPIGLKASDTDSAVEEPKVNRRKVIRKQSLPISCQNARLPHDAGLSLSKRFNQSSDQCYNNPTPSFISRKSDMTFTPSLSHELCDYSPQISNIRITRSASFRPSTNAKSVGKVTTYNYDSACSNYDENDASTTALTPSTLYGEHRGQESNASTPLTIYRDYHGRQSTPPSPPTTNCHDRISAHVECFSHNPRANLGQWPLSPSGSSSLHGGYTEASVLRGADALRTYQQKAVSEFAFTPDTISLNDSTSDSRKAPTLLYENEKQMFQQSATHERLYRQGLVFDSSSTGEDSSARPTGLAKPCSHTTDPETQATSKIELFWRQVVKVGDMYSPRYHHDTVRIGKNVYLFGGNTGNLYTDVHYLNDLYSYNTSCCVWRKFAPIGSLPAPRCGHTMVAYDKACYVFGGTCTTGTMNDIWTFNEKINAWQVRNVEGRKCTNRAYHSAVTFENKMFVYGGNVEEAEGVVWTYDILQNRWQKLTPTPSSKVPKPRQKHVAATRKNWMFIHGGIILSGSKDGQATSEMWRFCMNSYKWKQLICDTKAPKARAEHGAVRLGSRWIIHGGRGTSTTRGYYQFSDSWCYDIRDNGWNQLPASLLPFCQPVRWGHKIALVNAPVSYNCCSASAPTSKSCAVTSKSHSMLVTGGVTMTLLALQ